MGYPVIDVNKLAIYTKKLVNEKSVGRVWLIAGEGSPRKYYLRATFIIKNVEPSENLLFTNRVSGTDGQLLDPMPLLNSEPWFSVFVKEQGRFAFGFNKIKNSAAIDGLRKILIANTLR